MPDDVAKLGIAVDSSDAEKGTLALDKFASAAAKAEKSADQMGAAVQTAGKKTSTATAEITDGAAKAEKASDKLGGALADTAKKASSAATEVAKSAEKIGDALSDAGQEATKAGAEIASATNEAASAATRAEKSLGKMGGSAATAGKEVSSAAADIDKMAALAQKLEANATRMSGTTTAAFATVGGSVEMAARKFEANSAKMSGAMSMDRLAGTATVAAVGPALAATGQRKSTDRTANDNQRLGTYEWTNLSRQLQDVITMGALGASPMQIATSQGAQFFDIFASSSIGAKAALADFGSTALRIATNPLTILAAVVATAGVAVMRFRDQQSELERAINGVGRAAGASAGQLSAIAGDAANSGTMSRGQAVTATATFAQAGIGVENIPTLLADAQQYSRAFGLDLADASAEIAKIVSEQGLGAFERRFGSASFASKEMVRSLEASGRYSEAAALKTRMLDEETKKAKDSASALSKAWEWVSNLPGRALDSIGGAVNRAIEGPSSQQQLAQARGDYFYLRAQRGTDQSAYPGETAAEQRVKELEKRVQEERDRPAQERRNLELNKLSQRAGSIIDETRPDLAQYRILSEARDALKQLLSSDDGLAKLGDRADDARKTVDSLGVAIGLLRSPLERVTEANALAIRSAEAESVGQRAQIAAEQAWRAEMEMSRDRLAATTAAEGARNVVLLESAKAMQEQAKQATRRADLAGLGSYERAVKEAQLTLQDDLKKANKAPGAGADMSIYDRSVVVPFDRAGSAATRLADAMTGAAARIEGGSSQGAPAAATGSGNVVPLFARSGGNFYSAIQHAEGTDKFGDAYNTSLGYRPSAKPLVDMSMRESLAWGEEIARQEMKRTGLQREDVSSAKGAFQITNATQRDAMRALGLGMNDNFNAENQNRMADWIFKTQGVGAWEGFKSHPADAAVVQSSAAGGNAKSINEASEAYRKYGATIRAINIEQVDNWLRDETRSLDDQRRSIDAASGSWGTNTAAIAGAEERQRLLNEAQRAGIPITDDLTKRIDALSKKAADNARITAENRNLSANLDVARGTVSGTVSGGLKALTKGEDVGDAIESSLSSATDRLIDQMSTRFADGLLGASGTSNSGIIGQLLGIGGDKSTAQMDVNAGIVNLNGGLAGGANAAVVGGGGGGLLGMISSLFSGGSLPTMAQGGMGPDMMATSSGSGWGLFSSIGSLFGFDGGGVMTSAGALPLHRYDKGGVANSPQLAMFGEGRVPEAYVPLPDGRSIPVRMQGPPQTPQSYGDSSGASRSGGSATMPQTQVTVHGAPAEHDTEVKETRRKDGGVSLEIQLKRVVKKMVSDGELDRSFQRYGMRPGTVSR